MALHAIPSRALGISASPASALRQLWAGAVLLAVALSAIAVAAADDGWQGERVVSGRVTDTGGEPIKGAEVELGWSTDPSQGPAAVYTNRKGSFVVMGLAAERFSISVRAAGFIVSNGWVTVSGERQMHRVDVQLLSLDWEPPGISENGSLATVTAWVEKGFSLYQQGMQVEARREYERALRELPPSAHAPILSAVAGTYYKEGNREAAVETLVTALQLAPADAELRRLYLEVMEQMGRSSEAEELLAELDANPAPPPSREVSREPQSAGLSTPEWMQELMEAPAEPAVAHRAGTYKTFFQERSPWSDLETFTERHGTGVGLGAVAALEVPAPGALNEESFQVYVPEDYRADRPHGLFVWVSPIPFGGPWRNLQMPVLAERDLIWIGAHDSGNQRPFWHRIWLALDAAHNMQRLYNIDPERIYVGGYSGGGRIASRVGVLFPELFRGVFSNYGCDYFRAIPVPERPGTSWPAKYERPPKPVFKAARLRNRFALLSGRRDFNYTQTRATVKRMRRDGFSGVTFLEIPDADHLTWPPAEWWNRAFDHLDGGPGDE